MFTYEIPDNVQAEIARFLRSNGGHSDLAQLIQACKIDLQDMGLAYYAGMKGDNWDKRALDLTIEGSAKNINLLKQSEAVLKNAIAKVLRPSTSGFLIRNIEYMISDDNIAIDLPKEQGETFEVLLKDINDALVRDEPTLVLDRLHTYSTRFLRELCEKHFIRIKDDKEKYFPLHDLMGKLRKYYRGSNMLETDFTYEALSMSISLFQEYNKVRNDKSYAHDNNVLNKTEASYVVSIIAATLALLHKIEKQYTTF